ncbi:MAG: MFS transporter [Phormidesmis sp.]
MQKLKKLSLLGTLYFSQFLPFWFLYQALPVLLRQKGMSLEAIGLLPLVTIATSFKFLWSPLVDKYSVAKWGHYRFWIIVFQLWVVGLTLVCSLLQVDTQLPLVLLCLAFLGLGCASQDIATDALALRMLSPQERGFGNAIQGIGGALGRLVGGGGMLILLSRWDWGRSLWLLAGVMLLALVPILFHREADRYETASRESEQASEQSRRSPNSENPESARLSGYIQIFWRFCQQPGMALWLAIVGLYVGGYAAAMTMFRPLLVDAGLSLSEIGLLMGVFGAGMTMLGSLLLGVAIAHWGRRRSLLLSASLTTIGIASFTLPAIGLTHPTVLYSVVGFAFFANGMMATTIFTIMMDKSRKELAGTDYTIQSCVISLGGILASALSGVLASAIQYQGVFVISILLELACITLIVRKFTTNVSQLPAAAYHVPR